MKAFSAAADQLTYRVEIKEVKFLHQLIAYVKFSSKSHLYVHKLTLRLTSRPQFLALFPLPFW